MEPNDVLTGDLGDVTPGGTPNPAPTTPIPQPPTDTWETRFKNLQRSQSETLNRLGFQKFDDIPARTQLDELRSAATKLDELQQRWDQRDGEFQTLSGDLTTTRNDLANAKAFEAKVRLVAQEGPELIEFVDDIPTHADPEAQKQAILNFKTRLQRFAEARGPQGVRLPQGGVPPTGGNLSLEEQMRQAQNDRFAAIQQGDKAAAETARKRYFELEAEFARMQSSYEWAPPAPAKF